MRRTLLAWIFAAAALFAGGVATAGASTVQPPRASLQYPICQTASNSLDRLVAVTAVMRPITGTAHMQLQFELFEKPRGTYTYSEVMGGDLGRWVSPGNPTLGQRPDDVWKRQKQVVNLAGPALYRFHVGFRWTGAHGETLRTESRWGETCSQP
jgi:hypothetical protein